MGPERGSAQRYPVVLRDCSLQSTWQYPWTEGEGFGFLLPVQSLGQSSRAGGRKRKGTGALLE